MRKVIVNDEMKIILGRLGEDNALMVMFPVEDMVSSFGKGTFNVLAQRNIDDAPYPVATTFDGRYVYWSVSNSDLSTVGEGKVQLTLMVGGSIVKTKIWKTLCLPSLDESPEVPEPYESWVNQVIEAASTAQTFAEQANNNANRAEEAYENTKAIDEEVERHITEVEDLLVEVKKSEEAIEEDQKKVTELVTGFDAKVERGKGDIEIMAGKSVGEIGNLKDSALRDIGTEESRVLTTIGSTVNTILPQLYGIRNEAAESSAEAKKQAETATSKATSAGTYASNASSYANNANASKELAEQAVEDAKAEVVNAAAEVTKAKQEVENAKAEVVNAKAEVANAQGYANEAKGYRDELSGTIETVAQHSEAIVELQGDTFKKSVGLATELVTDPTDDFVLEGDSKATMETILHKIPTDASDTTMFSTVDVAPTSSTSEGLKGQVYLGTDNIYFCIANNTWRRISASTF